MFNLPFSSFKTSSMNYLTRTRSIILLLVSISLLLFVLLSLVSKTSPETARTRHFYVQNHLQIAYSACEGTLYPDLCVSTISVIPNVTSKSFPDIVSAILNVTLHEVTLTSATCSDIENRLKGNNNTLEWAAVHDCLELLNHTLARVTVAVADLTSNKDHHKLQTFLSAAMTNQYTCLDGFDRSKGNTKNVIENAIHNISHHISNSLVILNKIPGVNESRSDQAFPGYGHVKEGFPAWLSLKDRKLLRTSVDQTKFDLIVASDGSGNFTTISQAVAAAPANGTIRFVIYIKAGSYSENVEVGRDKKMLMFVGDGIGKTVVTSSKSVVGGSTTFRSATVAVVGDGFIAKGMSFVNAAGPSKLQAVAFRCGSDLSAFYKCSFVAYQDTLYVHSLRQFYRECDLYGTVDSIFGNAAVVFQSCNLYARRPDPGQNNTFTAQGRDDPNQNTGISILHCKIRADVDLLPVVSSYKTYLGRPWKQYSRTVVLKSYIDNLVDPAGWSEWGGSFGLETLYYGEYLNKGPGSSTSKRVTWPGYRVIKSANEAFLFTAGQFLQGNQWLSSTHIPFYLGLS